MNFDGSHKQEVWNPFQNGFKIILFECMKKLPRSKKQTNRPTNQKKKKKGPVLKKANWNLYFDDDDKTNTCV